ncbi:hypothetical protein PAESOLCIP111_04315 [Paenibacillus solanacearum]|uniref:Uncharacterized protein n=1 Tax=Paenibacillus solanacearum TaxID=2048548 RepID=A0A916NYA0_9BACL|nr:hypothetical protein PAESOLCIP111_04315 [Paenibacillus solanacearum]
MFSLLHYHGPLSLNVLVPRDYRHCTGTVYPEIQRVEQAYLGFIPVTEFLKLIENDTGDRSISIWHHQNIKVKL